MSFLDALSRSTDSPATDYHLCIFNNPNQRDAIREFFSDQKVFGVVQEINLLETHLYILDKKKPITKRPFSKGLDPTQDTSNEWSSTHLKWKSCKDEFKDLLENFQSKKLNKKCNSHIEKIQVDNEKQDTVDKDLRQDSLQQSASEFLLSLAGMFDSGVNDISENVEAIVTNLILKKHERE